MSKSKKIFWALALLILLPIAAFIAINAFDEPLDPKAAVWGEPRAAAAPEAENGYFVLIAMGAPDGGDGPAYARAWLAEARAAAKEKRNEKHAPATRTKRPDVCNPAMVSCITAAREKGAELTTALEAHKEDLARYRTLILASRYEEVLDYPTRISSAFPAYGEVARAQRGWLTQAALAAEAGNIDEALAAAERDITFYRMMLGSARTLVGKMVAVRGYWTALAFVSDLLQQKSPALEAHVPRLRTMLQALDPAALKVDAAMETEFGAVKHMFANPESEGQFAELGLFAKLGTKLLFKPNATINRHYRIYSDLTAALNQPPAAIDAAWAKASRNVSELGFTDYINNPVGKMLLALAIPDLRQYALRLHDLDAFNRLVTLRLEVAAANVGVDQTAEFTAKSAAKLHDPYTGKPMAWDAAKKRIQFKPMATKPAQAAFNVDAAGAFVAF